MNKQQKFVVIVFPNGLQGRIWSTILRSQNCGVIWESPDVPLPETLKSLHQQGDLPDLLIIDTRLHHLRPWHLCRWCRQNNLNTKVLLVNGAQPHISPAERQWAITQGSADLLPRICRNSLMSGAAANLRRALDLLNIQPFSQQSFIGSLLQMGLGSQPNVTINHRVPCEKI